MGPGASIGPLAIVAAHRLRLGKRAVLKPLSLASSHTIELGQYVQVAPTAIIKGGRTPKSRLVLGDHSRIFPFCWLEPGEGMTIGKHVGIGGHNLLFTHGAWSDYLLGGPMGYGPITIEDNVWLPWRIMVLANVTIGANSVIMAGSVVSRSIPPNSIAGGMPAKFIKEGGAIGLDPDEKTRRALEIIDDFGRSLNWRARGLSEPKLDGPILAFGPRLAVDNPAGLGEGDLLFAVVRSPTAAEREALVARGVSVLDHPSTTLFRARGATWLDDFVEFVRRYGIRLYVEDAA
jgi:carbonic anhydrase/acetyltransferase-like protein (isoleucine patch superfamily)